MREKLLNIMSIETELECFEIFKDIEKMEKIHEDMNHMLKKKKVKQKERQKRNEDAKKNC